MTQSALHQITPHIYWLSPDERTDRPILGAITGSDGTLLVDAGNSPAHIHLFLDELTSANINPPKFAVLTHWHWDHVFGLSALNVPVFAHKETKRVVENMAALDWSDEALDARVEAGTEIEFCRDMLKLELPDRSDLKIVPPDIAFSHAIELTLGNIVCHIDHVGGDHSSDSTVVYIPSERIVFLGDCLYQDIYHGEWSYSSSKLFPLLDKLRRYDAEFYLDAHRPQPYSRAEFLEYVSVCKTIGKSVERLGDDRMAILSDVAKKLGQALDEDELEIVDAFLAGRKKEVKGL